MHKSYRVQHTQGTPHTPQKKVYFVKNAQKSECSIYLEKYDPTQTHATAMILMKMKKGMYRATIIRLSIFFWSIRMKGH